MRVAHEIWKIELKLRNGLKDSLKKRGKKGILIRFLIALVLGSTFMFVFSGHSQGAVKCWTGGGADNNWYTALNWKGGSAPTASDIAEFDNVTDCPIGTYPNANKNMTIGTNIGWAGISIVSYSGTISTSGTATVTLGTSGFSQADGTFTASS